MSSPLKIKLANGGTRLRSVEIADFRKIPHPVRFSGRVALPGYDVEIKYGRIKWLYLADSHARSEDSLKMRSVYFHIIDKKKIVGAMCFNEFEASACLLDELFDEFMDSESSATAELGDAMLCCWEDFGLEVLDYGNMIEFSRAQMSAGRKYRGLLAALLDHYLTQIVEGYSILVMKAFPLEYEGAFTATPDVLSAFEARQKAMVAHYRRSFGVEPLPGSAGASGWLWKPAPRQFLPIEPNKDGNDRYPAD